MDRNRFTLWIGMLLLMTPYGLTGQETSAAGRDIFRSKCQRCHGKDGTRGFLGAANLQHSSLGEQELFNVISNGRRVMPAWKKQLKPAQIRQLIVYVRTLQLHPSK